MNFKSYFSKIIAWYDLCDLNFLYHLSHFYYEVKEAIWGCNFWSITICEIIIINPNDDLVKISWKLNNQFWPL